MVTLGPEEATALNTLARQVLAAQGKLSGPSVRAGRHEWRAGDEIRVLRSDQRLGPVAAGAVGTVASVDPEAASVSIRWAHATSDISAPTLARSPVTYAYATTPAYARAAPGPVFALGDPGQHHEAAIYVVAPNRRDLGPPLGRDVVQQRQTDALATAALIRPPDTVLAHLGPPPPGGPEQDAWRRAAGAIEWYRDRWAVADRPERLDFAHNGGLDASRQADQLRVLSACRAAQRALAVERHLGPPGP
jgi:hypothetical protein